MRTLFYLSCLTLAAVGCGDKDKQDGGGAGTGAAGTASEVNPDGPWAKLHEEIFVPHGCDNAFCHGNAGELNLSLDLGYEQLVDAPSQGEDCKNKTTKLRVEPGDPDASLLIDKVVAPSCGERMPVGLPKLSAADVQKLRDWIADGAPKN
jgi:hypothetical protein